MAPPQVGETLDGKYRIDAIIGSGNIGVVARAHHLLRDADVAIKFLRPDDGNGPDSARNRQEIVERFRLEAVASSRLATDHVVQVHDVGETADGTGYLVMEHLVGSDLERILAKEGRLSTARSLHIVLQAARALAVAHEAGVIHRDLKPGNIFLCERDGETDFVKILDFGISKLEIANQQDSLRLTSDAVGMGTPLYMAPEQARDARSATAASDTYSLAAVLYECISGKPPLDASSTVELLYKLVHETPQRLDETFEVPRELASAVAQALDKNPKKRPASMEAFAAQLAPFADERSDRALASLRLTPRGSRSLPPRPETTARRSLAGTHFAHDVSVSTDELSLTGRHRGAGRTGRTRWELVAAFGALTVACFALGTYMTGRVARSTGLSGSAPVAAAQASPSSAVPAVSTDTDGAAEASAQAPAVPPPSASTASAPASASAVPSATAAAPSAHRTLAAKLKAFKTRHQKVVEEPAEPLVPYVPTVNLADNPTTADVAPAAAERAQEDAAKPVDAATAAPIPPLPPPSAKAAAKAPLPDAKAPLPVAPVPTPAEKTPPTESHPTESHRSITTELK
jgi:eukaryotic-like serine/threonine-protein kinase